MGADSGGSFIEKLFGLFALKGAEGESRITEQYEHGPRTKVYIQALLALGLAISVSLLALGLILLGGQVSRLFNLQLELADYMLAGLLAAFALGGCFALAQWGWRSYLWRLRLAVGLVLALFVGIAVVAATQMPGDGAPAPRLVVLILGLALVISCGVWTAYQLQEMLDPWGKTSPTERIILPKLAEMFDRLSQQPEEPERVERLIPGMVKGQRFATSKAPPARALHPDDEQFISFIEQAGIVGLGRRAWLKDLSRDKYDGMIARAQDWGFIEGGGGGRPAHWLMEPNEAVEILRQEAETLLAGVENGSTRRA